MSRLVARTGKSPKLGQGAEVNPADARGCSAWTLGLRLDSDARGSRASAVRRFADGSDEARTEKEMQPYKQFIAGTDVDFDMVPIPGGKFTMGSPPSEKGHKPDEGPQHQVKIEPFWMGKCEVHVGRVRHLELQSRHPAAEGPAAKGGPAPTRRPTPSRGRPSPTPT